MVAVVVIVVLAGWAVPLLLLVEEVELVVHGWRETGVEVVMGGAVAAGEGDTVLARCKPL